MRRSLLASGPRRPSPPPASPTLAASPPWRSLWIGDRSIRSTSLDPRQDKLSWPTGSIVTRLVGTLLLEQADEWATQRRYMTLEPLCRSAIVPVSDNPAVSLPAAAVWQRHSPAQDSSTLLHHGLEHDLDRRPDQAVRTQMSRRAPAWRGHRNPVSNGEHQVVVLWVRTMVQPVVVQGKRPSPRSGGTKPQMGLADKVHRADAAQ